MNDYNRGALKEPCLRLDYGWGEQWASVELGDGTGYVRLSDYEKLKAENAKLRELCASMWQAIPKSESCEWDFKANCCTGDCNGECWYWYRMRELGIEVECMNDISKPMAENALQGNLVELSRQNGKTHLQIQTLNEMVERLREENAKLQAERDEWHRVVESKQDIIDHMRDARTENAKLRELVQGLWFAAQNLGMNPDGATGSGFARQMRELGVEADDE